MDKQSAITKLQGCLDALNNLYANGYSDPAFKKWHRDTEIALEHVFGTDTRHLVDFRDVDFGPGSFNIRNPGPAFAKGFANGKGSAKALLQSMIEEVQDYWPASENNVIPTAGDSHRLSNRVFIIHGHDSGTRDSVARLIKQFDLDPIILHEKPNKGQTIIEKIEENSNVGFAVVVLTGDDRGGESNRPAEEYSPRARQNVILELGLFLGRLGRDRVCVLYQEGVEIPSDYDGVVYVPLDKAQAWRFHLGRELKAAGFNVDLNKII